MNKINFEDVPKKLVFPRKQRPILKTKINRKKKHNKSNFK